MSDDLADFFEENTHWVDSKGNTTSVKPPKPPKSRREMRRRRNVRRRKTIIVLTMVVAVLVVVRAGGFFGVRALRAIRDRNDGDTYSVQDYSGQGYGSVEFTVSQGESPSSIAKRLVEAEVVKSADAFTGVSSGMTLYPGTYQLRKHMPASSVAAILSDQSKAEGFLDVNAGERVSDVIKKAAALSEIDESEFQKIIDAKGEGILPAEAGGNFEGGLEPGKYDVKGLGSAQKILKSDYYGKVTRVILNRLDRDMTLGMDSTTAYGLGINGTQLTNAQLNDSSNKYHPRVNKGLTPTPISNPGDSAIQAAMNPEQGDWLYFVTVNLSTGETKFTTGSVEEQNAQFEQYVKEYKDNNKSAN